MGGCTITQLLVVLEGLRSVWLWWCGGDRKAACEVWVQRERTEGKERKGEREGKREGNLQAPCVVVLI